MNIHDFDDIRPFLPEELPEVYDRLLANPDFQSVVQTVYQNVPFEQVAALMRSTKDANEFQTKLVYPVLTQLIQKASTGLTSNLSNVLTDQEKTKCHTFVSNHRDIVLDSALLCYVLQDNKLTTVEIAIGDNLLIKPWILDLVRVNKSFIVQRALTMRQMLLASAKLSKYMHFAINEKHENVWIAQREGRAKDSNDRTQESVLKMMSMGEICASSTSCHCPSAMSSTLVITSKHKNSRTSATSKDSRRASRMTSTTCVLASSDLRDTSTTTLLHASTNGSTPCLPTCLKQTISRRWQSISTKKFTLTTNSIQATTLLPTCFVATMPLPTNIRLSRKHNSRVICRRSFRWFNSKSPICHSSQNVSSRCMPTWFSITKKQSRSNT